MKQKLSDGRWIMASYKDIKEFFETNCIKGRKIIDIIPNQLDYMDYQLGAIENVYNLNATSAISTDGQVCLVFEDGDHLEIGFCGDAPIILGFNTADFDKYPQHRGDCYTLKTLFGCSIGQTIKDIVFEKSETRMMFPVYCGIDMSEDDDGIKDIAFVLEDNTYLKASGVVDWFDFEHCEVNGQTIQKIPYKDLFDELNKETLDIIFEEC